MNDVLTSKHATSTIIVEQYNDSSRRDVRDDQTMDMEEDFLTMKSTTELASQKTYFWIHLFFFLTLAMPPRLSMFFFVFLATLTIMSFRTEAIGVNWGTVASRSLDPDNVVELLNSNNITKIKLFDADKSVLLALKGSDIRVTVSIDNSMLEKLNSSKEAAYDWVHEHVTRYYLFGRDGVKIEYVAVGDEPFLESYGRQFYPYVVGAAINIQLALIKATLDDSVKVVVPCSSDVVTSESNLPSQGRFRTELKKTMIELLTFLAKYEAPFFVTISPFATFNQNKTIPLDFTLFDKTARPVQDGNKSYKNSFDLSYDTLVTALRSVGFPHMNIVVSKIGWPTDGGGPYATPSVASVFMTRLMNHLRSESGTPLRPRKPPNETYIYSLLDENNRTIESGGFERHWGLFTIDGQTKYKLRLGNNSKNLVSAEDVEYLSSKWCVLNVKKYVANATARVVEACSVADCTAMSPGGSCSNIRWDRKISYAFNSYFQSHDQDPSSCDFGGLGSITTVDPSLGKCRFYVQMDDPQEDPPVDIGFTWLVIFIGVNLLICLMCFW